MSRNANAKKQKMTQFCGFSVHKFRKGNQKIANFADIIREWPLRPSVRSACCRASSAGGRRTVHQIFSTRVTFLSRGGRIISAPIAVNSNCDDHWVRRLVCMLHRCPITHHMTTRLFSVLEDKLRFVAPGHCYLAAVNVKMGKNTTLPSLANAPNSKFISKSGLSSRIYSLPQ